MNKKNVVGKGWAKAILLALVFLLLSVVFFPLVGGMSASNVVKTAKADVDVGDDSTCYVHYYKVDATVNKDRTIDFSEEISFTLSERFDKGSDTFYRSLPIEGDRYFNIKAEGVGNSEFAYYVADNPDMEGFIDINCTGGVKPGATLTYRFSYTMEVLEKGIIFEDGMIIDFVGAGWPFALRNVEVNIQFPAPLNQYTVFADKFGDADNRYVDVLDSEPNQLRLYAESLPLESPDDGGMYAVPITVRFSLEAGAFEAGKASRTLWVPFVCGAVLLMATIVLFVFSMKKPVLSTVVGFTAPDGMDPMELGFVLDGTVDTEDITSMIYYFASKGYLSISLHDGEPTLKRTCERFPESESAHAKAIFDGLFVDGREETVVKDLQAKFYQHADQAKTLIRGKQQKMYVGASVARFIVSGALALALFFMVPTLVGLIYVGGGYVSPAGLYMFVPILSSAIFTLLAENYRYKWSKKKRVAMLIVGALVWMIGIPLYAFSNTHLLTLQERIITLVFGCVISALGSMMLVRREAYMETMGKLMGFKEFILVTKKDRLEAMMETSPDLFYDVLPYAQVMGVSDVWEEKFKSIAMEPPRWYDGDWTLFDFWLLNSSMRSMRYAMLSRPSNGGSVGGIGGGGSFGGFAGGGGGGGGGGFR